MRATTMLCCVSGYSDHLICLSRVRRCEADEGRRTRKQSADVSDVCVFSLHRASTLATTTKLSRRGMADRMARGNILTESPLACARPAMRTGARCHPWQNCLESALLQKSDCWTLFEGAARSQTGCCLAGSSWLWTHKVGLPGQGRYERSCPAWIDTLQVLSDFNQVSSPYSTAVRINHSAVDRFWGEGGVLVFSIR